MKVKAGVALLLSGNEAVAYGALAAGARFFAGYPITPSTEVAEVMAAELPRVGGKYIQMEDEIASLGAVIGASIAGVKSITATSGPGFSLMQEHIGFAAMAEVPCVIVDVMRGGPSTGLPTKTSQADVMQAKYGSHGDYPSIALAPGSVMECFTLTIKAFNLSEKYRVPAIILSDEIVELVNPGADTKCPYPLRRVAVWDDKKEREIVLLTNHLEFGATTISAILSPSTSA
jgi:2-oxoglutarate ferredoxin oxidoreductase subunit alpha